MAAPGRPLSTGVDRRVSAHLRRDLPARHGVVHGALRGPGAHARRRRRPRSSLHHTGAIGRTARVATTTAAHPGVGAVASASGVSSTQQGRPSGTAGSTVARRRQALVRRRARPVAAPQQRDRERRPFRPRRRSTRPPSPWLPPARHRRLPAVTSSCTATICFPSGCWSPDAANGASTRHSRPVRWPAHRRHRTPPRCPDGCSSPATTSTA